MRNFFGIIAVLLFFCLGAPAQDSATEIVKKAEDKLRGNTSKAELTIRIVRPTWSRELRMKSWTKGKKLAMILITAPAKEKGTVFLKRDKEVWNWIPSIERSIKLPPSMMSQSWMGTDFTNDDLVKESSTAEDYTHKLIGDTVISGLPCYAIEMIPKPEAAIVWGKVLIWIDKKNYMEMLAGFYDEDGQLINRMRAVKTGMLSGKMLPTEVEMIPVDKPGHKTVLIYENLVFDQPIEDSFFTTQQMKIIR